ncbi:MAG: hypothetical protein WC943_13025 [Elusimicrobiota bacterium]|jgi:hypothetical protein
MRKIFPAALLLAGPGALTLPAGAAQEPASVQASTIPARAMAAFKFLGYSQDKASGGLISPQGKALTPEETASWVEPHDCDREPLHSTTRMVLLANGYRIDDIRGDILTPNSKTPMTRIEIAALVSQIEKSRRHDALLAMQSVLETQSPGQPLSVEAQARLKAIAESSRDVLPPEISDILAAPSKAASIGLKQTVSDRYMESARFFDGEKSGLERLQAAAPGLRVPELRERTAYFDDHEKRLGAALSKDVMELFSANPVGRELLDGLKDRSGQVRLPAILLLRLGSGDGKEYDRAGAVYVGGDPGAVIFDSRNAARVLGKRWDNAKDSTALETVMGHSEGLDLLFSGNAALRKDLLSELEVTLAHELTHAVQFRRDRAETESSFDNLPGIILLEDEHEAFLNQSRYLHEKLKSGKAGELPPGDIDVYRRFLVDFDLCREHISQRYMALFPAKAGGFKTVAELQAARAGGIKRLMAESFLGFMERSLSLLGLDRGTEALEDDETEHKKRINSFLSGTYPSMRAEGSRLLAQRHRSAGRPDLAFLTLSQFEAASKEPSPELQTLADEAWRVSGMPSQAVPLPDQINVLQELRAYHARHGRPVSPEFEGSLKAAYVQWAVEQFAAAKKAATPSERERLLDYAKSFADAAKSEVVAEAIEAFRKTKGASR